jgi:hypothetical protein
VTTEFAPITAPVPNRDVHQYFGTRTNPDIITNFDKADFGLLKPDRYVSPHAVAVIDDLDIGTDQHIIAYGYAIFGSDDVAAPDDGVVSNEHLRLGHRELEERIVLDRDIAADLKNCVLHHPELGAGLDD